MWLLAAVVLAAGCSLAEGSSTAVPVIRVADGDTLTVRIEGRDERVRVLGIDAPEIAKDGQPAGCGAGAARAELRRLVGSGPVAIAGDPVSDERDRYDRLLAYVTTEDDSDVGLALIEGGFAAAWYPSSEPRPNRYLRYKAAEIKARLHGVGLWSTCPTVGR